MPTSPQFSTVKGPEHRERLLPAKVLLAWWPDHYTNENWQSVLRNSPRKLLGTLVDDRLLVSLMLQLGNYTRGDWSMNH
jgi:hypothetical protein